MLKAIFKFFEQAEHAIDTGIQVSELRGLPLIESFARMGTSSPEEEETLFNSIERNSETIRNMRAGL